MFLDPTLRLVCLAWRITIRYWQRRRSFPSVHSTSRSKHWGRQSGSSWRRNRRAHTHHTSASGSGESQHSSANSSWEHCRRHNEPWVQPSILFSFIELVSQPTRVTLRESQQGWKTRWLKDQTPITPGCNKRINWARHGIMLFRLTSSFSNIHKSCSSKHDRNKEDTKMLPMLLVLTRQQDGKSLEGEPWR